MRISIDVDLPIVTDAVNRVLATSEKVVASLTGIGDAKPKGA